MAQTAPGSIDLLGKVHFMGRSVHPTCLVAPASCRCGAQAGSLCHHYLSWFWREPKAQVQLFPKSFRPKTLRTGAVLGSIPDRQGPGMCPGMCPGVTF